jgi:hypothetical protein
MGGVLSRRTVVAALGGLAALGAAALCAVLLGSHLERAVSGLGEADVGHLWLAAGLYSLVLVSLGGAWREAFTLCGARLALPDSCSRYTVASLVGSVFPGAVGGATRVALFARSLEGEDKVWRASGAAALVSCTKMTAFGTLLAYAAMSAAVPRWSVGVVAGVATLTFAVCMASRRKQIHSHVGHVLDAFRALGAAPKRALRLGAWVASATAFRVLAAAAVAAAFGIHAPLQAALLIVPAVAIAALAPITPANAGLSSGAVMVALAAHGIDGATALSVGLALNAVETGVGVALGLGGLIHLASYPSVRVRRLALSATGSAACIALVAAFGSTV